MREVDFAGGVLQNGDLAAGILVALLEGLELRRSLALEAEGGGDFSPFDLERCASLLGVIDD